MSGAVPRRLSPPAAAVAAAATLAFAGGMALAAAQPEEPTDAGQQPAPAGRAAADGSEGDAPEAQSAGEMEEVIVRGRRDGDPSDLDARNEELLRQAIADEFERLRSLDTEQAWRDSLPKPVESQDAPRIKWGYDPEDEMRMRMDSGLTDLPGSDGVRPATLFRFKF